MGGVQPRQRINRLLSNPPEAYKFRSSALRVVVDAGGLYSIIIYLAATILSQIRHPHKASAACSALDKPDVFCQAFDAF